MSKLTLLIIIIVIVLIVLWFVYRGNFKKITIQCINLITGAPKTGKSLLCSDLAPRTYKKIHRKWWFATHILRKDIEEPLFYTNVVFSFKNIKNRDISDKYRRKSHRLDKNIRLIEEDTIKRCKTRLAYRSVVYIQECSLLSDNQDYQDNVTNVLQSLFFKLFGHETKNGVLFLDTQNCLDCHYAIKRCTSSYLWIQKSLNFFFFRVLYVREMINGDSMSATQNNFNEDVDFTVRKYIVWRRCYKRYDRFYYSYMTDDLPVSDKRFNDQTKELVSFNPLYIKAGQCASEKELREVDNMRTQEKAIKLYTEKLKVIEESKKRSKEEKEVKQNG